MLTYEYTKLNFHDRLSSIAARTRAKRPQLRWTCREHRSERPRSKEQHRLQLCAKPPRRPIAAQRASESSLPASGAKAAHFQALAEQCWPASFAVGGSSAHLAGARSTRSWLSSQANRSGGVPEQSRHAAPAGSCFLDERGHRGACLRQIALNADMTALALQHRPQRSGRSGGI